MSGMRYTTALTHRGHLPADAIHVSGHNVHDYVLSHGGFPQGLLGQAMPITPPWPTCTVEFTNPLGQDFVVVTYHMAREEREAFPSWLEGVDQRIVDSLPVRTASVLYQLLWQRGRTVDGLSVVSKDFLDAQGRQIAGSLMPASESEAWRPFAVQMSRADIRRDQAGYSGMFAVAHLTFAFCHAKNVSLQDVAPPPKVAAKRRKAGKPVGVTYKTLVIDGMKEVLRTEGGVERNGLKKALHICRGHFATYTADAPLFGKVTGTFWRPMHTRGSKKRGEVKKDYKVIAGE